MEVDSAIPSIKTTFRDQDFYSTSIEPKLLQGREAELFAWLKEIGFIQRSSKCKNPGCNGHEMEWKRARIIDKFNWVCPLCKKKSSVRSESFLEDAQCSVRSGIEAILNWCEGVSVDAFIQNDSSKLKANIAKRIYSQCNSVVDWYMLRHPEITILGGENTVVIVDIFPDGRMTLTPHNNNFNKRILCVADTFCTSPRIWTHIMDSQESKDPPKVIPLLLSHIRPGSTLVVTPQLFPGLRHANDMAEVISIEALMSLDHDDYQRSLKNLETIWASTVSVCQEIQDMTTSDGRQLLNELQWRSIFRSHIKTIFEHIMEYQTIMQKHPFRNNARRNSTVNKNSSGGGSSGNSKKCKSGKISGANSNKNTKTIKNSNNNNNNNNIDNVKNEVGDVISKNNKDSNNSKIDISNNNNNNINEDLYNFTDDDETMDYDNENDNSNSYRSKNIFTDNKNSYNNLNNSNSSNNSNIYDDDDDDLFEEENEVEEEMREDGISRGNEKVYSRGNDKKRSNLVVDYDHDKGNNNNYNNNNYSDSSVISNHNEMYNKSNSDARFTSGKDFTNQGDVKKELKAVMNSTSYGYDSGYCFSGYGNVNNNGNNNLDDYNNLNDCNSVGSRKIKSNPIINSSSSSSSGTSSNNNNVLQ